MTDLDVALRLDGRLVVTVGGGRVGLRRVRRLVAAGARVRVVSPDLVAGLQALVDAGTVAWEPRGYAGASDLDGAWLVHTATGVPEVDDRVAADAEALHLFCVHAADADHGSVQVLASREIAAPEGGTVRVAVHGGRDGVRAHTMVEGLAADLRAGRHDLSPHRPPSRRR